MNPVEDIKLRLQRYPDLKYEAEATSINVPATSDSGFDVSFEIANGGYIVSFNGWHETFEDAEEALNCFAFGLSDECRLKEYRRGSFAYRWIVEHERQGKWVEDSETSLVFFPFWRRKEIVYLQNRLIKG